MDGASIVKAFIANRRAAQLSPQTIEWYEKHARLLMASAGGELPTNVIQLEEWIGSATSPEYARTRRRAISVIYRWGSARGLIDEEFVRLAFEKRPHAAPPLVPMPRGAAAPPRVFTAAETDAIEAVAAWDPHSHAMITTLLLTGMRIGALEGLTKAAVEVRTISVLSKGKFQRVPAHPRVIESLMAIFPLDPSAPLFTHKGGAATSRQLQRRIRTIFEMAGIRPPKAGPHTLRHTFATRFLSGQKPGTVKNLQTILGHSSVAITEKYSHLVVDDGFIEEYLRVLDGPQFNSRQLPLPLRDIHGEENTGT